MTVYHVIWTIDIEASTIKEAIEEAMRVQRWYFEKGMSPMVEVIEEHEQERYDVSKHED
jgi:hypothetical protein